MEKPLCLLFQVPTPICVCVSTVKVAIFGTFICPNTKGVCHAKCHATIILTIPFFWWTKKGCRTILDENGTQKILAPAENYLSSVSSLHKRPICAHNWVHVCRCEVDYHLALTTELRETNWIMCVFFCRWFLRVFKCLKKKFDEGRKLKIKLIKIKISIL